MTTETPVITYTNFLVGIYAGLVRMGYRGIVPPETDEPGIGDEAAIETYRYMCEKYPEVPTRFCIFPCDRCGRSHDWRRQLHEDANFLFHTVRSYDSLLYFKGDVLLLYIQDSRYFHGSAEMWRDLSEHFRDAAEPVLHRYMYHKSTRYHW